MMHGPLNVKCLCLFYYYIIWIWAISHHVNECSCEVQSVTFLVTVAGVGGATVHGRLVVCYISAWSVYRPGRGSWSLDNLDPTLCTHLVYAFAGLDNKTNTIRSLDEYHDLEDNYGKGELCNAITRK